MAEQEAKSEGKRSFDAESLTNIFKDFFFFSGEVTRSEFAQRIIYVALAAFISLFWFAIPFLHSLFLLGTIASLASLVVRRLRNVKYHWAFVFLGLIPLVGWVALAVFAALKPRSEDGLGRPKIQIHSSKAYGVSSLPKRRFLQESLNLREGLT